MTDESKHIADTNAPAKPIKPVEKKEEKKSGLNIFVGGCNSLLGYMIVEELRNDHIEDEEEGKAHLFYGTLDRVDSANPPPNNIRKVVNFNNRANFLRYLSRCDVIIYDIRKTDIEELRFVVSKFKEANPATDKTLILISSAMTWGKMDTSKGPYTDKSFIERVPSLMHLDWKLLENEALVACRINTGGDTPSLHPHKRSYVVAAGLVYGLGEEYEESLYTHFMRAWNAEPEGLYYIGTGQNIVPTIHIKDLSKMISKLIVGMPDPLENPYFLAVDKAGPAQTQMTILQKIASKLGVDTFTKIQGLELRELYQPLSLNANLLLSDFFDKNMEASEWHCQMGFSEGIDKVFEELKEWRGLRGIRIVVSGPPASGKTKLCEELGKKYNLPILKITEVVEEAKGLQDEFGEKIREELSVIKQKKVEELEALAKKKKGIDPNPDLVIPRMPMETLQKVYERKLKEKLFQNKGYIMDGYPKTCSDANYLFIEIPPPKVQEGEEEEKVDIDACPLKSWAPSKIILLEATDEFLLERVNSVPEEDRKGTHYDKEGMIRRLQEYKDRNDESKENPPFITIFQKRNIEVLNIKAEISEEEQKQQIEDYIEKEGKIGIPTQEVKIEVDEIQKEEIKEDNTKIGKKESALDIKSNIENSKINKVDDQAKEKEKELLESRSQMMRKYLMDKVIPTLAEGVLKLCKDLPEEPIDYLFDFLMAKSAEKAAEEKLKEEQKALEEAAKSPAKFVTPEKKKSEDKNQE